MKLFAKNRSVVIWQPTGAYKATSGSSGYTYGLSKWVYPLTADSLGFSYYTYATNWLKNSDQQWQVVTDLGTEITLKTYPAVAKDQFALSLQTTPRITQTRKASGHHTIHFDFTSPRKGRVPAILVRPATREIKLLVCFQHGIGAGYAKELFLAEAQKLAAQGIASLMIDAPFIRQDEGFIKNAGMQDGEIIKTNTHEWLQALAVLSTLNVSTANLAFVGHSYGARVGALLAHVDGRFRRVICVGGIINYTEWLQTTLNAEIVGVRAALSDEDFRAYVATTAPYDVSTAFLKRHETEFYFQGKLNDAGVSEYDLLSCYETINGPKSLSWYAQAHLFEGAALTDRLGKLVQWAQVQKGR